MDGTWVDSGIKCRMYVVLYRNGCIYMATRHVVTVCRGVGGSASGFRSIQGWTLQLQVLVTEFDSSHSVSLLHGGACTVELLGCRKHMYIWLIECK